MASTERSGWKHQRVGDLSEELGSCLEVDVFRVRFRAWLFVKEGVPGVSSELYEQRWPGRTLVEPSRYRFRHAWIGSSGTSGVADAVSNTIG